MSTFTNTIFQSFITETCISCGVKYAMTSEMVEERKNDHKSFFCPNGHSQHYTGKSEKERLQQELNDATVRENYLREANRKLHDTVTHKNYSIRSLKAAKTKIINRVKNGVCPCCNRTFQNLQNHFKTKHPELLK